VITSVSGDDNRSISTNINVGRQAHYYDKHPNGVKCLLCPHYCIISEGQRGRCRTRHNIGGVLYATNYAQTIAFNLDPMEKKPLYHFYPFSEILSLGPNSCNLHCQFCQNYTVSLQDSKTTTYWTEDLLEICLQRGIKHVAFTYSEPFTWYEYILDTAPLLRQNGISVVLVTNGFINPEPLSALLPYISAMNIDIKAFSDDFYQKYCQGRLQPVLDTVKLAVGIGSAFVGTQFIASELTNDNGNRPVIEITLLLIESLNDDLKELQGLYRFLADISPDIPLHISKYFPRYRCTLPQTSEKKILECANIAREYLNYVYVGNIHSVEFHNTLCPHCGQTVIDRAGRVVYLVGGCCKYCHSPISGQW